MTFFIQHARLSPALGARAQVLAQCAPAPGRLTIGRPAFYAELASIKGWWRRERLAAERAEHQPTQSKRRKQV